MALRYWSPFKKNRFAVQSSKTIKEVKHVLVPSQVGPIQVFDGHNDTLLKLEIETVQGRPRDFFSRSATGHLDLPRCRQGGLTGGLFAMFVPANPEQDFSRPFNPKDPANYVAVGQEEALAFTFRLIERAEALEQDSGGSVVICRSPGEIRNAMAADKLAISLHIEGAEAIDPEFMALEDLYKRGLRSIGLVWSRTNAFATGVPMHFPAVPDIGPGLTCEGKELVRACNRLGVLVDLSHLNEKGFWDVAGTSQAPLVASHSNAHALCQSSRNLTDRQLDAIRDTGGLVGVNFHVGFLREDGAFTRKTSLDTVADHVCYLIDHLGENHVGLGSDFDGCMPPADLADASCLPKLFNALIRRGLDRELLGKIASENWIRALDAAGA